MGEKWQKEREGGRKGGRSVRITQEIWPKLQMNVAFRHCGANCAWEEDDRTI